MPRAKADQTLINVWLSVEEDSNSVFLAVHALRTVTRRRMPVKIRVPVAQMCTNVKGSAKTIRIVVLTIVKTSSFSSSSPAGMLLYSLKPEVMQQFSWVG